MIFSSSCYFHVSSILPISKRKKIQSVQKKDKRKKERVKKRFKADQSFIQFDVTQTEFNYVLILIVNMGICFDPKSSLSEAQELIRSIEFLLKKLYSLGLITFTYARLLLLAISAIIVCWKDPSLPTITS
jgi:hypothetical protein